MLGICTWEYTINEACIGHFLWKYCIYNKIKIKLPLLKIYNVLLKKKELPQFSCWNKNKDSFGILERFPTEITIYFFPFFPFSIDLRL